MKREMKQATVYCVGVKVRCRKEDRHSFNLPELPAEEFNQENAEREALAIVRRNMKTVRYAKMSVHPFMLEDDGHMLIRSFSIGLGGSVPSVDLLPKLNEVRCG